MFSQGQLIFMGFCMLAFVLIMIFSYRKDIKLHQRYYRGSKYVLLAFFLFIGFLFFIKYFLDF